MAKSVNEFDFLLLEEWKRVLEATYASQPNIDRATVMQSAWELLAITIQDALADTPNERYQILLALDVVRNSMMMKSAISARSKSAKAS